MRSLRVGYVAASLAVFGFFVSGSVCFAKDTDPFAKCLSFESPLIPDGWQAIGGSLEVVDLRFKQGRRSLLWRWQQGGRLVVNDTEDLPSAATALGGGKDAADGHEPRFIANQKEGGLHAWIYNETPTRGKLRFRFGTPAGLKKDNPRYQFELGLNFKGWRAVCVHFEEDALNEAYQGSEPVVMMEVFPPAECPEGRLFFDLVDFTEYVSWKRTADFQFPTLNSRLNRQLDGKNKDNKNEVENWNSLYAWSQLTPPEKPALALTEQEKQAFRVIEKRYEQWLFGTDCDLSYEPLNLRWNAIQKSIDAGKKAFETFDIKRQEDCITGTGFFTIRSPYSAAMKINPLRSVVLPLALDFRLNGNRQSRDKAIDMLDYLHDQGWAEGSGLETLNHQTNQVAGYMHAIYVLKDELEKAGILEREVATMRWMIGFGEVYRPDLYRRVTADAMRTKYMYRLLAVLAMPDSPQKALDLKYLSRWLSYGLEVAPGYADTIKPDFTGYHHRGVYGSAYSPQAWHIASQLVYLLHDTVFAVASKSHENLRQALLTQRLYSNLYDVPVTISGRFPYNLSVLNRMLPSYAYMALAGTPVDAEMAAVFKRLWDETSDYLRNDLFAKGQSQISYFDSLGSIELMGKAAALSVPAETAPQGNWSKPYAGLMIHRRDDWMACVKGWSAYIWDFESSATQNLYGRYLSHGTLQLYGSGTPIGSIDSGYDYENGWDWNRWPGATTIHLRWDQLVVDKTCTDEYKEGRHRNFTDETFVGGVSLRGRNGLFAMALHDTAYDRSFRANKSVFFFDDQLICLGSGIVNDCDDFPTETTLFQCKLSEGHDSVRANSPEKIATIPFTKQFQGETGFWLMDPLSNAYILPRGGNVYVQQKNQQSPHHSGRKQGQGTYAAAWIDHGKSPKNAGYEYAVIVQTTPERATQYTSEPAYEVVRRDNAAHIVRYKPFDITAYAIFDSEKAAACDPIVKTSAPVMVMTRPVAGGMVMSLCDPDMRRPKMNNMSLMPATVLYADSQPAVVTVKIRGKWTPTGKSSEVRVAGYADNCTHLEFTCCHAKTIEVELKAIH